MRVVLDTNILVSGLINPYGPPGDIIRAMLAGRFSLCVDARLLMEYEEVLKRPRFGFDPADIDSLLAYMKQTAETHAAPPLKKPLPDPGDSAFLEVALASHADALVTGNVKHFPASSREGVDVVNPRAFVEALRRA